MNTTFVLLLLPLVAATASNLVARVVLSPLYKAALQSSNSDAMSTDIFWLEFPLKFVVSLLGVCIVGSMLILWLGSRRPQAGLQREAVIWPRNRLAVGLLITVLLTCITFWNMDLAAQAQLAGLRSQGTALLVDLTPPRTNNATVCTSIPKLMAGTQRTQMEIGESAKHLESERGLKQKRLSRSSTHFEQPRVTT